ncbi:peptidase M14 [Mumia sp. ZJ1417]|uniref:zinc carboxypeptidase n=1 Tax=Mumia sp. ZJ1417 TaxID=2708082 RepID=UPI00141DE13A|nr:zinc carboxypeptidase [Mumia sp. ZJ1417]QMW67663.1 peptidase M14 [Mumia sp. ZJ1417]
MTERQTTRDRPGRRRRGRIAAPLGVLALTIGALAPGSAAADEPSPYEPGLTSIVEVTLDDRGDYERLTALGLDEISHHGGGAQDGGEVEVMLHAESDARTLRKAGFGWDVVVEDVDAVNREARAEESAASAAAAADPSERSDLPTGRVSYRTLQEVSAELASLAKRYPNTVTLFRLPRPSLLGTPVYGVEITHDVKKDSGKPVFLLTGLTHSREWPTTELTMEFLWDLVQNDRSDARITSMLERGRLVAVPVVNPDGYEMSRGLVHEQKRKNCRVVDGEVPTRAQCAAAESANVGVDLNRNYTAFWGGPGSGARTTDSNYRGAAPASEPEIANMIDLVNAHQVTLAISNHTPDERVLRAPSAPNEPTPAEEAIYQQIAEILGQIMGWPAGPWPEIYYDASGTAEQTSFYTSGTFAFTFENTPGHRDNDRFHPPYPSVIDQYLGTGEYEGSTAREAFLTAFGQASDPTYHALISGSAKPGTELALRKDVTVTSSPVTLPGESLPLTLPVDDRVETTLTVPSSGRFSWHVNPSDRPSQAATANIRESWSLSCRRGKGEWKDAGMVRVTRGTEVTLDRQALPRSC